MSSSSKTVSKVVEPHVRMPSERFMRGLTSGQRTVLRRLLEEPTDYIDQERFNDEATQQVLFGVDSEVEFAAREVGALPTLSERQMIGAVLPKLTAKQECLLFDRYNYSRFRIGQTLIQYKGRTLSPKGAKELLLWAGRAMHLRSQIIQLNVPLVLSMAKRSRLGSLDFGEMVSEGNLALIRSVEKFDPHRGFKFSTYACRAILKSFSRVAIKTSRYRGLFPVELNTDLERSDQMSVHRDEIRDDCIDEVKHILAGNMADLNEIEHQVIMQRFAIGEGELAQGKTLQEVGAIIGVTKERVRQIQNRALEKLRLALEDQFLAA